MLHRIVSYFQTLENHPIQRMVLIIGGMLILWMIEGAIPLITLKYKKNKARHAAVNLSFTAIHLVLHTGFAVLILLLSDWAKAAHFGLVYWFNASIVATIIISCLTLDFFGGWLVHIVEHKVKWLWRFHIIHHADNNVDVTTGLRHHPVESVVRGIFFLFGVIVSGAPMYGVMIFQTLLIISTQFTHANIKLPKWLDNSISWVLVSPNMHKVHHHWKQPYTDSNYSAIFSIWDRLLGTFKKLDPDQLRYGLDKYYPNEKDEDFSLLMKAPFQKNILE